MTSDRLDLAAPDIGASRMRASPRLRNLVIALSALVFVIGAAGRIFGPSDLGQNADQSLTMSFTVDMVANGNWILPQDTFGRISRKPPLVNWLGAPLAAMGYWGEWAFKMPSLLAALATFLTIAFIGRRLLVPIAGEDATALGWCAAAAWAASPSAVKHMYFLRPDMALIACATIAWAAAVVSLQRARDGRPRRGANAVFWLFVGLAALAKGPFALLLIVVPPLTALAWFGSLHHARGAGCWWGIPLAGAVFSIWFVPALIIDREHVLGELIGMQIVYRVGHSSVGILAWLSAALHAVGYFFERFAPFSLAAAAALVVWRVRGLRAAGVMPAAVWPVVVVSAMALLGLRLGSFPAPCYPAAAVVSVAFLYWWGRARPNHSLVGIVGLALLSVVVIVAVSSVLDRGAVSGKGDAAKAFARQARSIVGSDSVVFVGLRISAVPSLMGRHQAGEASVEDKAAAAYVVMNRDATDAVPIVEARSRDGKWHIGLFRGEEVVE
jgi:4-amino-4-deoxy-L-arabinose transferase-like glycosyltransferase